MQGTNDDAMDIDHDDDSSSDNGQASEANDRKEKINLLEMPREILEGILVHLDDKSMLKASHVCKLFASVAETAFARKYSKEYYYYIGESLKSFEKVMLTKYGGQMRRIDVYEADEETLDLIEEKCCSLEKAKLAFVPKMIRLKNLKKISLIDVENLDRATFAEFISHNQQLESLVLVDNNLNLIKLLDGRLNSLKKLKYDRDNDITTNLPKIRLHSLETLELQPFENGIYARLLQSLECNQLKRLGFTCYSGPDENDAVINAICKFKTLAVLRMPVWQITLDQLKKLATRLPSLSVLCIKTAKKEPNLIENCALSVLSIFPKLSKLSIRLDEKEDFVRFASDVKSSIIEFHGRFAGTSTEIEIEANTGDTLVMSKDFVYVSKRHSLELHWMANLNEDNVRSAIAGVQNTTTDLKFINHCVEHTLDICAILPQLKRIESLDIQSDEPITFKANSSRHHNFFPHLKILKFHLDPGNATGFLQKLDGAFCERIQELWLDTEGCASREQELEHVHDMTNILAKFKNLKSLHLVPAFAIFDTKHVMSVCQSLDEIKRIRRRNDETIPSQE